MAFRIRQEPMRVFDAISQEYEACVIYGAKSPEKAVAEAARRARLILR